MTDNGANRDVLVEDSRARSRPATSRHANSSGSPGSVSRHPSEPPELRNAIGTRLRQARAAAGLTQQQVAVSLQRRKSWLGKLERGQRSLLSSEAVELADAYCVALVDLWPGSGSDSSI